MARTDEQHLDTRELRRLRADDRAESRMDRREREAEKMIGELNSGKFYVYPVGGKYREGNRADLIAFLLRNGYA